MDYIKQLSNFTNMGNKAGREALLAYYASQGHPQKNLKVIHVTGTAGKGSTSKMTATGLAAAGYKVGLLTSPHLQVLNERIQINGTPIADTDFDRLIKQNFEAFPHASFSEYLTLVAVAYFLEQAVDFFVCEVFVGGTHDTTNIFDSVATVITSIGLDHQHILGETIEEILTDKLGIVQSDTLLFTRLQSPVIDRIIAERRAIYHHVTRYEETNLLGPAQRENAGIAYEVLAYLGVPEDTIHDALMQVSWPGRMEYLAPNILVDAAHNPIGMKRLSDYIQTLPVKRIYYLFALSKKKDFSAYAAHIYQATEVVLTQPSMFNIADPEDYTSGEETIIPNTGEAYRYHKDKLTEHDLLVVCGSIFLVSEVLAIDRECEKK